MFRPTKPRASPEVEFNQLVNTFKNEFQRDMDVLAGPEDAHPARYKWTIDNLSKLATQVSAIEKASVVMFKKMPDCETLCMKEGFYGAGNSIFLMLTAGLRTRILGLKKLLEKSPNARRQVTEYIDKLVDLSFSAFDLDPLTAQRPAGFFRMPTAEDIWPKSESKASGSKRASQKAAGKAHQKASPMAQQTRFNVVPEVFGQSPRSSEPSGTPATSRFRARVEQEAVVSFSRLQGPEKLSDARSIEEALPVGNEDHHDQAKTRSFLVVVSLQQAQATLDHHELFHI